LANSPGRSVFPPPAISRHLKSTGGSRAHYQRANKAKHRRCHLNPEAAWGGERGRSGSTFPAHPSGAGASIALESSPQSKARKDRKKRDRGKFENPCARDYAHLRSHPRGSLQRMAETERNGAVMDWPGRRALRTSPCLSHMSVGPSYRLTMHLSDEQHPSHCRQSSKRLNRTRVLPSPGGNGEKADPRRNACYREAPRPELGGPSLPAASGRPCPQRADRDSHDQRLENKRPLNKLAVYLIK